MSTALILALLLPVLQDDLQVTYREGLFEEVDQGNLDKAAELYAKVLKSGAPDALKAKALLRTGFCHEKKGRKKEAEQAWRDVIERYPKAGDAVKIAGERLSQRPAAEIPRDEKVASLILDLGSAVGQTQASARRTLLLLGDESVPQLKHALLHPDRTLSNNAARVLMDMGRYEGVYDAIKRFWAPKSDPSPADILVLRRLLPGDDSARRAFLKDVQVFRETEDNRDLSAILCALGEPELVKVVEDWIVHSDKLQDGVMSVWVANRPVADVVNLMKRLRAEKPPKTYRIYYLFMEHSAVSKNDDARAELLAVLSNADSTPEAFQYLPNLVQHFDVQNLVRVTFPKWLSTSSYSDRERLIYLVREAGREKGEEHRKLVVECRKVLFELMESPKVTLADKELIVASGFAPDSPEERKQYLEFCLQYWKENRGTLKGWIGRTSWSEEEKRKWNTMIGAMKSMAAQLPPESRDLAEVFDGLLEVGWISGLEGLAGDRRKIAVAVSVGYLARNGKYGRDVLSVIPAFATAQDRLELGPVLSKLGNEEVASRAAELFAEGYKMLEKGATEAQRKVLREAYDGASDVIQTALVRKLHGVADPQVDALMDAASKSDHVMVRYWTITHWSERNAADRISRLVAFLKDPAQGNQIQAINQFMRMPTLDAVPHLIELLESPSQDVREASRVALEVIKKHFEAQAEWKRWYDETKKALGK